jgi:hypothetical protein
MPEKKRYGRLMRIGQYSSSPALDDDSMKHISFDCDTKCVLMVRFLLMCIVLMSHESPNFVSRYKKDRRKLGNPATLHSTEFRPASQENIVAGKKQDNNIPLQISSVR